MALFKSLLTTILIFGVVWGGLIWKNPAFIHNEKDTLESSYLTKTLVTNVPETILSSSNKKRAVITNISTPNKRKAVVTSVSTSNKKKAVINLIGLKRTVNLKKGMNEVEQFWEDFYNHSELHRRIPANISNKVYGYYHALDENFYSAELTIGYNSHSEMVSHFEILETVKVDQFEAVIENSTSRDTTPAWDAIDQSRAVDTVLEEYVMGSDGNITATSVYVLYK